MSARNSHAAKAARRGSQYEWPMVTTIHPEHGSFLLHVHGVRAGRSDVLTLAVFANGANSVQQCDVVFGLAAGTDSDVVALDESDVSEDLALMLAARIHSDPSAGVLVVPGAEWGLAGAGRQVCPR